ncbi:MAG TPA: M23 family metallopeptidase [Allosphingosinicella sp.]|nr:M23 family metallopeptidase [Allosphingosinicella sp.]
MYRFEDMQPALAGAGGVGGLQPSARLRAAAPLAPSPAARQPFRLLVDLGVDIGSREWLRGAATCSALCYAATLFWPDTSALDAPVPAALSTAQWEEARALAIAPMSAGSTTGRRMAPTDAVQPLVDAPERPVMDFRVSLAAAGDLAGALTRAGVAQAEAASVTEMVGGVLPLAELAPGTVLDLRLGRRPRMSDPRPLERLSFRGSFALKVTIERVDGRLVLSRAPIAVDTTPLRIQGTIGASLYRSARAAGVAPHIVEAYIRALATQIGVPAGLSAGDRFDIIVEHRRAETGESESGNILYAGLDRINGRDIQLMPWSLGGNVQWLEASGVGRETSTGFRMPVQGRMTSGFGHRTHPIFGYARMHAGIDFGAPYGSPIVASANGQVTSAGWDGGYGNAVRISHGGGLTTLYGHMSRLAVSPGQPVAAGQVIGYVGSTGVSTGPHLHYELHRNGQRIDPASFRHVTRSQLTGAELEAFRNRMRGLLALPVGPAPAPRQATSISPVSPTAPIGRPIPRPIQPPVIPRPTAPRPGGY